MARFEVTAAKDLAKYRFNGYSHPLRLRGVLTRRFRILKETKELTPSTAVMT